MKKKTTLNGILSPLLKYIRIKKILKYIDKDASILDIGCDEAYILKYINNYNCYLGIDINSEIIKYNKIKYSKMKKISFYSMDIEQSIGNIDKKFDTVILTAVIEHLKDFYGLLSKLSDITTDKAILIITTPAKVSDKILKIGAKIKIFSSESLDEHEQYFKKTDFKELEKWELKYYSLFELFMNQLIILKKR